MTASGDTDRKASATRVVVTTTSLARLIKDHGDRWVIEHTGASTAWVAVRCDGDDIRIVGAHDVGGLKYKIEQAEKEDAEE